MAPKQRANRGDPSNSVNTADITLLLAASIVKFSGAKAPLGEIALCCGAARPLNERSPMILLYTVSHFN